MNFKIFFRNLDYFTNILQYLQLTNKYDLNELFIYFKK
jgi:hypothetical protein